MSNDPRKIAALADAIRQVEGEPYPTVKAMRVLAVLDALGYTLERKSTRTFHTQPAEGGEGSPETGAGRV